MEETEEFYKERVHVLEKMKPIIGKIGREMSSYVDDMLIDGFKFNDFSRYNVIEWKGTDIEKLSYIFHITLDNVYDINEYLLQIKEKIKEFKVVRIYKDEGMTSNCFIIVINFEELSKTNYYKSLLKILKFNL